MMRILIVGAGIAGLTLASLLKQRGLNPTVIEQSQSFGTVGYSLALYPTGADILRELNCYSQFLEASISVNNYEAYTDEGELLKRFSFSPITERYGPYQLITRYELLDLIYKSCDDLTIRFNTRVSSLTQNDQEVEIVFNDQTKEIFDLVVGADGLHSQIRSIILTPEEHQFFNTGWGGWVWWSEKNTIPENTIREFWGRGTFLGQYPVKGKVGNVAAIDSSTEEKALQGKSRKAFMEKKFANLMKHYPEFLNELPADDQPAFFWPLNDQRTTTWHKDRVVLLGDSATAFLPNAGIGATTALQSAAVLNDVLSRTGVEFIPQALGLFEKRGKERVEKAQSESRRLAKVMFLTSSLGVTIRNYLTKKMSMESVMRGIIKGFDQPI